MRLRTIRAPGVWMAKNTTPGYQAEIADRLKGGASMVAETTDARYALGRHPVWWSAHQFPPRTRAVAIYSIADQPRIAYASRK